MKKRPAIETPKYNISIQASNTHYCEPRENFTELDSYEKVEVALFDKDYKWVQPRNEKDLFKFEDFDKLIEYWENGDIPVGAYVPLKLINKFIKFLNQLEPDRDI